KEGLPHRIWLFYSNRGPEDAAFLEALRALATKNPHLTFIPTMTKMEHSHTTWTSETGYITRAMLERYIDDLPVPLYYLCGPATLVAAMRKMLSDAEVSDDNIRTEEFTGY